MPKNNNQTSPLDKLEQQMEQQAAEQEASKAEATSQQGTTAEQEQTAATASKYTPEANEKHLYHVQLETPYFSKRTGERLSTSFVQKFTEQDYKKFTEKKSDKDKSNAEMLGYTVKVLWNPKENI